MVKRTKKPTPKEDSVIKCQIQAGSINTNLKVQTDFTLPKLSTMKIVIWNCHVDESAKGRYDMILGRYLLTALVLNLNDLITQLKQFMDLLKSRRYPWLIWVRMSLKI